MNFKEIFDREIIVEEHVRKGLKIFYEIDLNLVKPKQETPEQPVTPVTQTPAPTPEVPPEQPATPVTDVTQPTQETTPVADTIQQAPEIPPEQQLKKPDLSGLLSSVQTEEDEGAAKNSEESIMRHFKGEYTCNSDQADNIQTFDDLINILGNVKKDGVNILDDFCKEIVLLCAKIFAEIYFGYKKDDSVGVRFKKSENSDSLSSSILIDNQIVTLTKFNIERVNQKIIEYRNYEVDKS